MSSRMTNQSNSRNVGNREQSGRQQPSREQPNREQASREQPRNQPAGGPLIQPSLPPEAADEGKALLEAILSGKAANYTPLAESKPVTLTIGLVKQYLCVPTKNGHYPTDADCVRYIMMCMQRGLNPWAQDCYLLGYDTTNQGPKFSLVVAIQALLKRAELARTLDNVGAFDGLESGVIVERSYIDVETGAETIEVIERHGDLVLPGDTLLGGWAKTYRKDRTRPFYQRLRLETYHRRTQIWDSDPAGMICKDAEAASLRQAFPSDIGGLYLASEIEAFAEESAKARAHTGAGGAMTLDTLTMPKAGSEKTGSEKSSSEKTGEPIVYGSNSHETSHEPIVQIEGESAGYSASSAAADGDSADGEFADAESGDGIDPADSESQSGTATASSSAASQPVGMSVDWWNGWMADIERATSHGELNRLAEVAGNTQPNLRRGLLDKIAEQRTKLGESPATPQSATPRRNRPGSATLLPLVLLCLALAGSWLSSPALAAGPRQTRFYDATGHYAGRVVEYGAAHGLPASGTLYGPTGAYAGRYIAPMAPPPATHANRLASPFSPSLPQFNPPPPAGSRVSRPFAPSLPQYNPPPRGPSRLSVPPGWDVYRGHR